MGEIWQMFKKNEGFYEVYVEEVNFSQTACRVGVRTVAGRIPDYKFPSGYGETRLIALVRDPYCIFAYWDVAVDHRTLISLVLDRPWQEVPLTLRLHDVTGIIFRGNNANFTWDITVGTTVDNWYVHGLNPDRLFCFDLGVYTREGQFFVLARSNRVETPPDKPRLKRPGQKGAAQRGAAQLQRRVILPQPAPPAPRREDKIFSSDSLVRKEADNK